MRIQKVKRTAAIVVGITLVATVVYAATINNPGGFNYTASGDSHWRSYGGGDDGQLAPDNFLITGSVDSNGNTFFDQLDFGFEPTEDLNGYKTQLQVLDDGTGTYCPNSGDATITITARIKITKYAGNSISTTPCYITIDAGNPFTLTTGTSGSETGSPFPSASFVAAVSLGQVGGSCPTQAAADINTYYDLGSGGKVEISGVSIDPSFTGDGC